MVFGFKINVHVEVNSRIMSNINLHVSAIQTSHLL